MNAQKIVDKKTNRLPPLDGVVHGELYHGADGHYTAEELVRRGTRFFLVTRRGGYHDDYDEADPDLNLDTPTETKWKRVGRSEAVRLLLEWDYDEQSAEYEIFRRQADQ
jgi:hypothetical protein